MGLKFVSKNNMAILVTLILVGFLSQAKYSEFITETVSGRMFLLACIVFISCINKIYGLVAVLAVIVSWDYHAINSVKAYNYYEGFDVSGVDMSGNLQDLSGNLINALEAQKQAIEAQISAANASSTTTTGSSSTSESFASREGFCMSDKETNMLRGKQSNSIPVNSREQPEFVNPSDMSVFSSGYSAV